jgi:hypothetical protein
MRQFVAGHRAMLGIVGLAALVLLFASMAFPDPAYAIEIPLLVAALIGIGGLVGSPYWKLIYKESPLRRAVTGITDLDERELALRDRANGLTYFLFATVNILLLCVGWVLVHHAHLVIDEHGLQAAVIPYAWFAVALPVILLEWFEPSGPATAEPDFDED